MRTFCTVLLMVGLAGCAWGQQVPRWAANLPVVSTEGGIDDGHTKPLKLLARLKALEDKTHFTDALRAQQRPSLQWNNGKCLPFCDERIPGSLGTCAWRSEKALEKR